MFVSSKYKILFFYIFSLLLIFFLPKGSVNFFDGIPWSSKQEIILFSSIFPFFFFLKFKILNNKLLLYFILFLNVLSLFLFFASKTGISHKQFFNLNEMNNKNFIKTYDTIWFKNYSSIQKTNWNSKLNFPIDWTSQHPINYNHKNGSPYFTNYDQFLDLDLVYKSNFFLVINKKKKLVIKLDGIDKSNSIIKYKKIDNNSYKNLSDFNKELTLETGIYEFEINSYFKEKKWSFEILFNENGKYKSAFDEKNIFYDLSHKNIKIIFFYNLIGSLFDYLVLLSIIYLITKLILIYSLNIPILIFSSLFLIVNLLFFKINSVIQFDKYGSFGLAIFLFVSLIIYLLKIYNFNKLNVKSFYLLISIFIIIFFSWMNFDNIENIKWFSYHDDWETFQVLARLIAVDNSWVLFEERETIRRYGIRFLIAFLHIIFGKSFFPQQLFEVWAIILSAFLFYKILIFSKINNKISLTFSLLLLIIFFGENFRWLIGRGLTEFYSLSLVMMTAYLFSKNKDLNNFSLKNIILPCLLGFLIVVFREDQIIIASSLIFFAIYKIYGLNIFKLFMNIFKKKYKILSFYYFFLMSGITLIMLKNFLSFGDVSISQDAFHYKFEAFKRMIFLNYEIKHSPLIGLGLDFNNVASNIDKIHYLDDLYRFFTASDPYHVPRPTSLFLILGFLSSFYFIFNLKKYKYLNLGIVLVPIVCLLNPLLFFNHAYNPRYIISYLPFALMSTCFFLKIINEKYNLRKVYKKLF